MVASPSESNCARHPAVSWPGIICTPRIDDLGHAAAGVPARSGEMNALDAPARNGIREATRIVGLRRGGAYDGVHSIGRRIDVEIGDDRQRARETDDAPVHVAPAVLGTHGRISDERRSGNGRRRVDTACNSLPNIAFGVGDGIERT